MSDDKNLDDKVAADAKFQREIADIIWWKIKGKPLPTEYREQEVEGIWRRYWHKAMESEQ